MKRTILAAGFALLAGPAFAQTQTTPATEQPATTNGIPNTALSTEMTPSTGPRSQEAILPSNSAAPANNSMLAVAPETTSPPPALAHYPMCKAGEFDHCMEPGNGAVTKKARWAHRRR